MIDERQLILNLCEMCDFLLFEGQNCGGELINLILKIINLLLIAIARLTEIFDQLGINFEKSFSCQP